MIRFTRWQKRCCMFLCIRVCVLTGITTVKVRKLEARSVVNVFKEFVIHIVSSKTRILLCTWAAVGSISPWHMITGTIIRKLFETTMCFRRFLSVSVNFHIEDPFRHCPSCPRCPPSPTITTVYSLFVTVDHTLNAQQTKHQQRAFRYVIQPVCDSPANELVFHPLLVNADTPCTER